jgi:hypothetical protein
MGYEPKTYRDQGGDRITIASGGSQRVQSGGSLDVESGGVFKLAGTQVNASAAELNELDLSAVGAVSKIKVINMVAASFEDNSEVGTGWSLPASAIVKDVFVNVNTAESTASTKTIDVGTDSTDSGDADGYLAGVSVAATGLVKGTLAYSAVTLGALLKTNTGDGSAPVPDPDISMGGKEITVTAGDSGGFTEADFDIIIEYIEVA